MSAVHRVAVVVLSLAVTAAFAQSKPEQPSKKPPVFSPSGVQGSTAPSGYSTGITREETSAAQQGVSSLALPLLKTYIADWHSESCSMEPELLTAVHSAPQSYEANHALGLFYLEHGNFSQSTPYLATARRLQPADRGNIHALILALLGEHRVPEAIDLLAPAPQDAVNLRLLGLAYQTAGNDERATESYHRAIRSSPADADNLLASGLGLLEAGATQQASETFQAATALFPKDARLWLGLGIAQERAGRKLAAVDSLLQTITLNHDMAPAYGFLAVLADVSPESGAVIRQRLAEFAVAHPSSAVAHYDYALALWRQRRISPAEVADSEPESQSRLALAADPSLASAHYLLGLIYSDAHDVLRAEQELSAAVKLEPANADAHYRLAQDYQKTHDLDLAANEMRKFEALRGAKNAVAPLSDPDLQSAGADLLQQIAQGAPCPSQSK